MAAVIGDGNDRIDGVVTRMGRQPVASTVLTLGMLVTDGALATMLDDLLYDLANPLDTDDEVSSWH